MKFPETGYSRKVFIYLSLFWIGFGLFTITSSYVYFIDSNTSLIRYSLKNPNAEFTSLKIYDVLGKQVSELINKEQLAGEYQIELDAKNFASGIYFYILKSGEYIQTRKMSIVK